MNGSDEGGERFGVGRLESVARGKDADQCDDVRCLDQQRGWAGEPRPAVPADSAAPVTPSHGSTLRESVRTFVSGLPAVTLLGRSGRPLPTHVLPAQPGTAKVWSKRAARRHRATQSWPQDVQRYVARDPGVVDCSRTPAGRRHRGHVVGSLFCCVEMYARSSRNNAARRTLSRMTATRSSCTRTRPLRVLR